MAFRILVISVAAFVGVLVGTAIMAELRSPTRTVVEPIVLSPGVNEQGKEEPRKSIHPQKPRRPVDGPPTRDPGPSDPETDDGGGAQPAPAPAPARAGEDDDGDDGEDDDDDDSGDDDADD